MIYVFKIRIKKKEKKKEKFCVYFFRQQVSIASYFSFIHMNEEANLNFKILILFQLRVFISPSFLFSFIFFFL